MSSEPQSIAGPRQAAQISQEPFKVPKIRFKRIEKQERKGIKTGDGNFMANPENSEAHRFMD